MKLRKNKQKEKCPVHKTYYSQRHDVSMENQAILEYIKVVNAAVPNAKKVFTEGNCGNFARMLLFAFPQGNIKFYLRDHFVFEYYSLLYDITGEVTNKYPQENLVDIKDIGDINELICSLTPRYKE